MPNVSLAVVNLSRVCFVRRIVCLIRRMKRLVCLIQHIKWSIKDINQDERTTLWSNFPMFDTYETMGINLPQCALWMDWWANPKNLIGLLLFCFGFLKMRAHVNSKWFLFRKKLDNLLHFLLPKTIIPLYTMASVSVFLEQTFFNVWLLFIYGWKTPNCSWLSLPVCRSPSPESDTMRPCCIGTGRTR